jgi:hypothetical protein
MKLLKSSSAEKKEADKEEETLYGRYWKIWFPHRVLDYWISWGQRSVWHRIVRTSWEQRIWWG